MALQLRSKFQLKARLFSIYHFISVLIKQPSFLNGQCNVSAVSPYTEELHALILKSSKP